MKISDIHVRDPFVFPAPAEGRYYLCASNGPTCWNAQGGLGFDGFWSTDLQDWTGPFPIFRPPVGFWSPGHYWAPEMHLFRGHFYLIASFKAPGVCRGTQVLRSESGPLGPYLPISPGPQTPPTWECLDGTLFVDDAGDPWLVFCHEWLQIVDGTICAVRLSPDLTRAVGEPHLLFKASAAPWVRDHTIPPEHGGPFTGKVTDGPYFFRHHGQLLMLWSSFCDTGYALGLARSSSDTVLGPWTQDPAPLYSRDGGHGMIFRTFDGRLMLTLHTPNTPPLERPVFLPLRETADSIAVL